MLEGGLLHCQVMRYCFALLQKDKDKHRKFHGFSSPLVCRLTYAKSLMVSGRERVMIDLCRLDKI